MKGLELTERARRLRPDMLIIVMTGFSEDFSYDEAIEAGASDFIKKPFTLQELMVRIRQAEMREEFRVRSLVDDLTGLYNRRGFMTLAEHQLKIANRTRKGLFLLYADLDGLKAINDVYGHHEGDQVLIEIAQILKENYRESDIVARVGGDEFVVFPAGTCDACVETMTARFRPHLVCLNPRHLRQLLAEYPEVDQEKFLVNLGFRVLLLHEYDLPHPRVAWLPAIKPVVRRGMSGKSPLQKVA